MYILIHDQHKIFLLADDTFSSIPNEINIENQQIETITSTNTSDSLSDFMKDKVKIEAAGGMIFNDKNELLMIFRRGFWDMPKGKLDPGETIEECAIREVMEETGLTHILLLKKLQTTYHLYPMNDKTVIKPSHWYLMKFQGTEQPIPQTEEDITEIKWIKANEARELLPLMYPSIREMVVNHFINKSSCKTEEDIINAL